MRWRTVFGSNLLELSHGGSAIPSGHNQRKYRARHWVSNGAITQDAMREYGWVGSNECKLCGGLLEQRRTRCTIVRSGKIRGCSCLKR